MDESKLIGAILQRLEDLAVQNTRLIQVEREQEAVIKRQFADIENANKEDQVLRQELEGAQKQLASEKGEFIAKLEQERRQYACVVQERDQWKITVSNLKSELSETHERLNNMAKNCSEVLAEKLKAENRCRELADDLEAANKQTQVLKLDLEEAQRAHVVFNLERVELRSTEKKLRKELQEAQELADNHAKAYNEVIAREQEVMARCREFVEKNQKLTDENGELGKRSTDLMIELGQVHAAHDICKQANKDAEVKLHGLNMCHQVIDLLLDGAVVLRQWETNNNGVNVLASVDGGEPTWFSLYANQQCVVNKSQAAAIADNDVKQFLQDAEERDAKLEGRTKFHKVKD